MVKKRIAWWGAVFAVFLVGCASSKPVVVAPDLQERGIKSVAVMPVENETGDLVAAGVVRKEVFEALYFKGYPRVPLEVIDEKLQTMCAEERGKDAGRIEPQIVGELVPVDAVLYCTLLDWNTSKFCLVGTASVAVRFEMKSAETGEILWSSVDEIRIRNYGITSKRIEEKHYECLEPAAREVVAKAMTTLPDGPQGVGTVQAKAAGETSWWRFW